MASILQYPCLCTLYLLDKLNNFLPAKKKTADMSICTGVNKIDDRSYDVLFEIFKNVIYDEHGTLDQRALKNLSLVSKRFHKISEDDRFWLKLAQQSNYDKDFILYQTETSDFSNKELYHLTASARQIDQLPNPEFQASAQLELIRALPANVSLFAESRLREEDRARQHIDKITDPHYKAKAQIKLVILNYCKEEIDRAKLFIAQIDEPSLKDSARIRLLNAFAKFEKYKAAETLIDQISDPLLKFEVYLAYKKSVFKAPSILLDEMKRAIDFMNQITDSKEKDLANEQFKRAYPQIKEKQKAIQRLWQIADPDHDALKLVSLSVNLSIFVTEISYKDKSKADREIQWEIASSSIRTIKDPYIKNLALSMLLGTIKSIQRFFPRISYKLPSGLDQMKETHFHLKKTYDQIAIVENIFKRIYQTAPLYNLPDKILLQIFEDAVSKPEDAAQLSLVCQKFKTLSDDDRVWQKLAEKKGYEKVNDLSWKQSYSLKEFEQKTLHLLNQLGSMKGRPTTDNLSSTPYPLTFTPYYLALGLMELYKHKIGTTKKDLTIESNQFIKINELSPLVLSLELESSKDNSINAILALVDGALWDITMMGINHGSNANKLVQALTLAYIELIKIYPAENAIKEGIIKKAKNLIEHSIRSPAYKAIAQIKLLKAMSPSEDEIIKAKDYINQIDNLTLKVSAQIKLLKVLYTNEEEKTANRFLEQMKDPDRKEIEYNHKALFQIKLMKIYLGNNEIEKAKNLQKEIKHSDFNSLARVMLLKIDPTKKAIIKTTIEKMQDPYLKALAQIEFIKVDPTEISIKIADDLIQDIPDLIDKESAKMQHIKAYLLLNEFEKAKDLINRFRSPEDTNHARILLLKTLMKNIITV